MRQSPHQVVAYILIFSSVLGVWDVCKEVSSTDGSSRYLVGYGGYAILSIHITSTSLLGFLFQMGLTSFSRLCRSYGRFIDVRQKQLEELLAPSCYQGRIASEYSHTETSTKVATHGLRHLHRGEPLEK